MTIPFTQFLRPNGRAVPAFIDRPEKIERKAQRIIDAGFVFECEELSTGHCSFTIADKQRDEDVAIEVCRNGPEVPNAIDRLIEGFDPSQSQAA